MTDEDVALTTEIVMFLARKNAETQSPGVNDYGNITVRYFPKTNRFVWFIDGKRTTMFKAMDAISNNERGP